MRNTYLCLFLALSCPAWAADKSSNSPGAPVLGLAYDESRQTIRPILGIPGAAILGDSLSLDFPLQSAAVAPKASLALALSADDHSIHLVRYTNGASSSLALDSAMTAPTQILFSPSGSAALLYRADSRQTQVVAGLSAAPTVTSLSLAGLPDGVAPAALSDDAQSILFLEAGSTGGNIWMLRQQQNPLLLSFPGALMSFRPNSQDVVAATTDGAVYLARNAAAGNGDQQVFSLPDGQSKPVAMAVSSDGGSAYVAFSSGVVTMVDLTGAAPAQIDCQCRPTTLVALTMGSMFRLSEISRSPVMLFDGSPGGPRTWFVPPPAYPAHQAINARGGR